MGRSSGLFSIGEPRVGTAAGCTLPVNSASTPMMLPVFRLAAAVAVLTLSSCAGTEAIRDTIEETVETATGGSTDETGNVVAGALYVENDSEADVCHLYVTGFDAPEADGFDLLEGERPLAPGAERTFQPGAHPLADEHNLQVAAEGCSGETFPRYAFSFVGHGGSYSVRPAPSE